MSCKCLASRGVASLVYCLTLMVGAIVAVSLRYGGVDLNVGAVVGISGVSICTDSASCDRAAFQFSICDDHNCKGYWAVYRIAFSLSGFFLLMAVGTACRCAASEYLHRGFWFAKALLLLGIVAGSIFAPNEMFGYYAWVARFVAPLFLLYQIMLYIDFGYTLNAKLVQKDDDAHLFCGCSNDSGRAYKIVNLVLAFALLVGSLTAIGVMYAAYPLEGCPFNTLAITTTLLFGLINTAISLSAVAEHGSLLTSCLILAYTTWLCYAALSAFPVDACNPAFDPSREVTDEGSHVGMLIVSCLIAGVSIAYLAYRMGSRAIGANAFSGGESKAPAIEMANQGAGGAGGAGGASAGADQVTIQVAGAGDSAAADGITAPESYLRYHLTMFIISMYMSMLLTDWGVPGEHHSASGQTYSVGYASAWLQLGTNWVCSLLYFWTLIAVKACPNRDFGAD